MRRSWRKDYVWPVMNFGYAGGAGPVLEAVRLWSRYREHLSRRSLERGDHIVHEISLWTQPSFVSWVQETGNSMWLLVDASLYWSFMSLLETSLNISSHPIWGKPPPHTCTNTQTHTLTPELVTLINAVVFRLQSDSQPQDFLWDLSSRPSSTAAWRSGDQVCVALLIVNISAKQGTYVKLIGILASLLISNHDLSICYLSSFNSSQITVCCNASCLLHHHARFH